MKENINRLKFYTCVFTLICFVFIVVAPLEFPFKNTVFAQKSKNELLFQTNSAGKGKKRVKGKSRQKLNQSKLVSVPPGSWGATGIGLVIEEDNVKIEYDCAEGEIKQKFTIDEQGNFSMNGVYIRRYPGALRVNLPLKRQPAIYEGKISGNTMTLKVTLTETNERLEEIVLERDKIPGIRRCL
jgi:hypothetical protein